MKILITYRFMSQGDIKQLDHSGNLDSAYRKIEDANGTSIHTAKGRLTLDQFVNRCLNYNVLIIDILTNGEIRYINERAQIPIPETSNTQEPVILTKGRYMLARFASKCRETGHQIDKGDIIYYKDKKAFCYAAITFRSVSKTIPKTREMAEAVDSARNKYASKTDLKNPVEVETEVKEVETEVKTEVEMDTSKTNDPFSVFAGLMKPYLKQAEINQDQINEMIDTALSNHSKLIEVKGLNGQITKAGKQHWLFEDLMMYVNNRMNVMLVGPAGSGKTYVTSEIAKVLNLDYYAISVGAMTTKTDFMGYMDANGKYIPTQFRRAFEHGGVFMLDELDAGNANVITTINMATANGQAAFPNGMIDKHKDFVIVAGANTFGIGSNREYVGRNQLDATTLNRFGVIEWPYDEELERHISCDPRWTRYVQAIRKNVDTNKIRHIVSPRQSIEGGRLLKAGLPLDKVKKYVLYKNLNDQDIAKLEKGIIY